jgi:hypothetical protein
MDDVTDKIQKKTRLNPDLIKFIATTKITAWAKCQASFFLYPELLPIYRLGQTPRRIHKQPSLYIQAARRFHSTLPKPDPFFWLLVRIGSILDFLYS